MVTFLFPSRVTLSCPFYTFSILLKNRLFGEEDFVRRVKDETKEEKLFFALFFTFTSIDGSSVSDLFANLYYLFFGLFLILPLFFNLLLSRFRFCQPLPIFFVSYFFIISDENFVLIFIFTRPRQARFMTFVYYLLYQKIAKIAIHNASRGRR